MKLHTALETLRPQDLRRQREVTQTADRSTRHGDMVAAIARFLLSGDLRPTSSRLSQIEIDALAPPPPELPVTTLSDGAPPQSLASEEGEGAPEPLRRVLSQSLAPHDLPVLRRLIEGVGHTVSVKTGLPRVAAGSRNERRCALPKGLARLGLVLPETARG